MNQRSRSPEEILAREMLKARARALARKEIQLAKTKKFQKGKLLENKGYKVVKSQLETMRTSVRKDYERLLVAY